MKYKNYFLYDNSKSLIKSRIILLLRRNASIQTLSLLGWLAYSWIEVVVWWRSRANVYFKNKKQFFFYSFILRLISNKFNHPFFFLCVLMLINRTNIKLLTFFFLIESIIFSDSSILVNVKILLQVESNYYDVYPNLLYLETIRKVPWLERF